MSGGIAQLVAIGAQDAHIVGKPEVSFFRSTYKRHTNFSQTVEKQVIQGNPVANGMSTVRFERKGDLLGYVYLSPRSGTASYSPAEWVNRIAKVEWLVGGQVIDTQESHFSQYIAPTVFAQNTSKSKSGHGEAAKSRFYPLRFSFCESVQSALPLVSLQFHDVELRITWGADLTGSWECYANFIYLDTDERAALANTPQNMLITQTQKSIASSSTVQEINMNHPVKYLASYHPTLLSIANDNSKVKLQINGTDVTDFKYTDPHYTAISEYYHTPSSKPLQVVTTTTTSSAAPVISALGDVQSAINGLTYTSTTTVAADGDSKKLFIYPFCLETGKLQPTGSLNFSRLDSARLLTEGGAGFDADIYGVNLNILRIENGMGGLMYSN